MAFAQEELIQIQHLIDQSLSARPEVINANVRYELDIRERIVRVEEELKHQRELMIQGFEMSNKRFEQMDKRFEQIDKHLTVITSRMDRFMFWSLGLTISAVVAIVKLT
ncbi:MAG: hypothetical protein CVV13_09005 [Gammaproteobacteria bacterium HGW-Gammaproteobacteria-3]|nr:MAG: hypothetical protein CVV13_09005 [Gammaproteobacteria bacterium HGW-Gammaproteobacteria-3]